MRRRHAGVAMAAVAVVGAGGAWAALAVMSGSSLDADERAVVEEVESGAYANSGDAARYVDGNVAVLLSEDVAGEVDGADLASLFEVALSGDAADGVFETVVSVVAEEGAIHAPELRPVLGDAAEARLSWFDARINAFRSDNSDQWSELRVAYQDAFGFLRATMRDPEVAQQLRQSMAAYGRTEVAAAPEAGEDRTSRLKGMGRLQAFFTLAYFEAETRAARLDGDLDAVEAAEEADLERRQEDVVDRVMWVALDRFESDPAVRAAAEGEPFADASGALKDDLSESETRALEAWATNQAREGGVLVDDVTHLDAGVSDARGQ